MMLLILTIRMIIGRGWGQGPTHAQSLQSLFAHIPGLKVVMPSNARNAKGLLLSSIFDPNPVIFLEHRWLHNLKGHVEKKAVSIPLGKASILRKGKNITLVTMSYATIEAIHAADYLKEYFDITCEIVDLRTVSPVDYRTVFRSISKTKKVLVLDTGMKNCSISSEIISRITEKFWGKKLEVTPRYLKVQDPDLYQVGCMGKITSFKETNDNRYLIELKGLIRFQIVNEVKSNKKYRECEINFKNFYQDLEKEEQDIKFSDLELIFKDLKSLFEKRGFIINWKALEKQSLDETINALAMTSPFTLEEKQVLLEAKNLDTRKTKISEILATYTFDQYNNTTIQ